MGSVDKPIQAIWELTNSCNANCVHCCVDAGTSKVNELSTVECRQIIDELEEMGIFLLRLSGGEPLLRPDIFDIIKYACRKNFLVSLASNGILASYDVVKRLKELGLHYLMLSLDGATPATHDNFRKVYGLFNHVLNVLEIAKTENLKVTLGFTATRINYREAPKIIDIALKYNASSVIMSEFVPVGRGVKDLDVQPNEWRKLVEFWIRKREELKGQLALELHDVRAVSIFPNLSSEFGGCSAGRLFFRITADGYVTPCPMLPVRLGNAREKSIREILETSIVLKELGDRGKLKGRCGKCQFKDVCGGCRAVAYAYTGDYLAEDPRCWYRVAA